MVSDSDQSYLESKAGQRVNYGGSDGILEKVAFEKKQVVKISACQ